MIDLTTRYLGLRLRSPIVASPGPVTGQLERLTELSDAGIGAVVLPSLFQEQIEHETSEIDRLFAVHHHSFGEASSFFPELDGYNTGSDAYLAQTVQSLFVSDVMTGLVKSVVFGILIGLVGAYRGLSVRGGPESVGRATTSAVVTAIILCIVTNAGFTAFFYYTG